MVLLIDSPPGTLGVPRGGLGTSCIADLALACLNENSSSHTCCTYARNLSKIHTHAGAINVKLLRCSRGIVEEESALVQVEGSVAIIRTVTACVLGRETREETAQCRIEAGILYIIAVVDGDQAKRLVWGGGCSGG